MKGGIRQKFKARYGVAVVQAKKVESGKARPGQGESQSDS